MERRLAAILAADVVGYTRLMAEDQQGTLDALRQLRGELFGPAVDRHRGNLIKSLGDGWIVEFPSISDAVGCAFEVQEDLIDHEMIRLRVGIHTGEVVFEADDVFGDGVNVAARLEAQAEPKQILISDHAYQSLDSKNAAFFSPGGSLELKNVSRPVTVWRWPANGAAGISDEEDQFDRNGEEERPSIAVLPFDNMSNDPDQDFFCDGLAEDIITSLSRNRQFLVVARNSSFTYRGSSVDIRKVGQELGVRYVLEGSVRSAGNRVRVTAQLIEAESGTHVWADKYDRPMDDIFEVQDDITENIAGVVGVSVSQSELNRIAARRPTDLTAYQMGQKATWHMFRWTAEDAAIAKGLCIQGIERAPSVAINHSVLGSVYAMDLLYGWTRTPPQELITNAITMTKKAIHLDQQDEQAHLWLAMTFWFLGQFDDAFRSIDRCIDINPNFALAYGLKSAVLAYSGQEAYEQSRAQFEKFARLSPRDGFLPLQMANQGVAEMIKGDMSKAVAFTQEATAIDASMGTALRLAISFLALNGDLSGAKARLNEYQRRVPGFTWPHYAESVRKLFRREEDHKILVEGWRLAGALD